MSKQLRCVCVCVSATCTQRSTRTSPCVTTSTVWPAKLAATSCAAPGAGQRPAVRITGMPAHAAHAPHTRLRGATHTPPPTESPPQGTPTCSAARYRARPCSRSSGYEGRALCRATGGTGRLCVWPSARERGRGGDREWSRGGGARGHGDAVTHMEKTGGKTRVVGGKARVVRRQPPAAHARAGSTSACLAHFAPAPVRCPSPVRANLARASSVVAPPHIHASMLLSRVSLSLSGRPPNSTRGSHTCRRAPRARHAAQSGVRELLTSVGRCVGERACVALVLLLLLLTAVAWQPMQQPRLLSRVGWCQPTPAHSCLCHYVRKTPCHSLPASAGWHSPPPPASRPSSAQPPAPAAAPAPRQLPSAGSAERAS